MDSQLERLETEALKLTAAERAAFAQRLLASLEEDDEIEAAWLREIERRVHDMESGKVKPVPLAQALDHIRAALV